MQTALRAHKAVIVLGPHRSGTSVVSRSLLTAGLDLGQHVLAPNNDNPKGFFENAAVVEFNDRLLQQLGLCWDYIGNVDITQRSLVDSDAWESEAGEILRTEFTQGGDIALKDPRLCLLAPFWDKILQHHGYSCHYVLVLRHPAESAASQSSRRIRDPSFHFVGSDLSEGALMWATYLHSALRFLSRKSATLASYDSFVNQPEHALTALAQRLSLELDLTAVQEFCGTFIDNRLRRHSLDQGSYDSMPHSCIEVYEGLNRLSSSNALTAELSTKFANLLARDLDDTSTICKGLQRIYVAARHTAIESNLALKNTRDELAKASRIISHNEANISIKSALLTQQIEQYANARTELIFERLENERLAIALAAAQDQIAQWHEDPQQE